MINFCVPDKFSNEYTDTLSKLNNSNSNSTTIYETYGSTTDNIIGSLRSPERLPNITINKLAKHIERLHKNNIKFNYILNSTVSHGMEFSKQGRQKIIEFIRSLVNCNIDSVTVAMPFLIEMIKSEFQDLEIVASICLEINNIHKAKQIKEMGASRIVLDKNSNRKISVIEDMVRSGFDLEVLCNSPCIYNCIENNYHANITSVFSIYANKGKSQEQNSNEILKCVPYRLRHPEEFVKAPWIRPEDTSKYHEKGISFFKLDGRSKPIDWNLEVIQSYLNEQFDGNLLYLTHNAFEKDLNNLENSDKRFKSALDNSKLDNFINFFFDSSKNCNDNCHYCNYCESARKKSDRTPKSFTKTISSLSDNEISNYLSYKGKIL
jgi:collagenase-like PrtC family protease